VATLYNQWAFEAALCNASSVNFVVDCRAFDGAGAGSAVKRLVFLARKLGVYYDLNYEGASAPTDRLYLTLYGPQEVSGAPQKYGLRLARLCRLLLGYSSQKNRRGAFVSAIVEASATVHFLQRSYHFAIDERLLALLPAKTPTIDEPAENSIFDSSIEQAFSEAFLSLAERQGVDGWQLQREPEPLLLERAIFIPDFAITRGHRRIYMEILGFWTPAYRERKILRLQQLRGKHDLVLAIPESARKDFAAIAPYYPIVYYDNQIAVSDLLHLLRDRYNDFSERLAALDLPAIRAQVSRTGRISEQECYTLLNCYRLSEIREAAALVAGSDIAYQPGLGLYTQIWMEQIKQQFFIWLQAHGPAPLAQALTGFQEARSATLQSEVDLALLETLLTLWPEVQVRRDSIFETIVELATSAEAAASSLLSENAVEIKAAPPRRQLRERRKPTSERKPAAPVAVQSDLWG
jgi:hypothetical protein